MNLLNLKIFADENKQEQGGRAPDELLTHSVWYRLVLDYLLCLRPSFLLRPNPNSTLDLHRIYSDQHSLF